MKNVKYKLIIYAYVYLNRRKKETPPKSINRTCNPVDSSSGSEK